MPETVLSIEERARRIADKKLAKKEAKRDRRPQAAAAETERNET